MPDKNVSLRTQGPILRLKSHLHLCALPTPSFPSSIFSVRLSDCLIFLPPVPPPSCSCDEGHRRLHCPPLPRPRARAAGGQITPATCASGRTGSPGTPRPREAFIRPPHLAPSDASHPLIPGGLSLRNGRCGGPGGRETRVCFKRSQRESTQVEVCVRV